jgi:transposase
LISYTKDQQLKHYKDRKAAKTAKQKGNDGEKAVQKELKGKRNFQSGKPWGGGSNGDVETDAFQIEVKNTERLEIPAWLRKIKSETPQGKKPGLVFHFEEERWVTIRLIDRVQFASEVIEYEGGEVYFP